MDSKSIYEPHCVTSSVTKRVKLRNTIISLFAMPNWPIILRD